MMKENQFSKVAKEGYVAIVEKGMPFKNAWHAATEKFIMSESGRNKGCPRAAFIGLCESGDLKGITGSGKSKSKNYSYAKFAAMEWKKDRSIPKNEMWSRVQQQFLTKASHQGQLDVIIGIYEFLK